jgi:sortase (surface protein transpeptidase)
LAGCHHGGWATVRALLAAKLIGVSATLAWAAHVAPNPPSAAAVHIDNVAPVAANAASPAPAATPAPPKSAVPVRVVIPSIGVNADLEALHRSADGTLSPPREWDDAGWYADGVVPGQRGPAVILGHVDSARYGPAVFYQLRSLHPGDTVLIDTSDGHTDEFIVDTVRQFPKTSFPTELVYGPTSVPELRLITCTGSFDYTKHSYLDNLIVTAYSAWTPQL